MDGALPPPLLEQQPGSMKLSPPWSRVISIGWAGIALALVCTGISSHVIGRPVFWLDDQRWSIPVLALLAIFVAGSTIFATLWAYGNLPWTPIASTAATAVVVIASIADRHASPGAATVTAALAASSALLSAASFIVRRR